MSAIITEKILGENPVLVKAFTGLPAPVFWRLMEDVQARLPEYERQRHERPDCQRAVGGGRDFDQPLVIRVAQVLTYLRLHIPQETVAVMFGAAQPDVSRALRRLLPLIVQLVPAPEVWQEVGEGDELSEAEVLELAQLADGRALVDATEQRVYRSQDSEVRKAHYSGKKKAFTLKTQFITDGAHHIVALSQAVPGAQHDKKLSDGVKTVERLPEGCDAKADKGYCAPSIYPLVMQVVCGLVNWQTQRWQAVQAAA